MTARPRSDTLRDLLPRVYRRLYDSYGPQGWWPGESRFEIIVGAILTQSTAWVNVEKALASLRAAECWSFYAIASLPQDELALVIRSSGYYNAKARKLQAFAHHVIENYGGDLDRMFDSDAGRLRTELLSIHGIGEETADDILVYAAEMPSFVMDTYTRRIVDRLGIVPSGRNPGYGAYQALFQDNLPADAPLFNEFHALLDHHAKYTCTKRAPLCGGCCLADLCPTAEQGVRN
ncbi:Putative DNA repair glycosylase MJ1434 [Geodia barretti]|uniref:DNA repair glycosylase MJ1434 n=1 Tax=Geodia barretti TaxID=519541 RepID=A0AA35TH24_GEOBA|nr:Putative DNA repair glycosylase MJ1434 [Geodia barretti]